MRIQPAVVPDLRQKIDFYFFGSSHIHCTALHCSSDSSETLRVGVSFSSELASTPYSKTARQNTGPQPKSGRGEWIRSRLRQGFGAPGDRPLGPEPTCRSDFLE